MSVPTMLRFPQTIPTLKEEVNLPAGPSGNGGTSYRSFSAPLELKLATPEDPATIPRDLKTYGAEKGFLQIALPPESLKYLEETLPELAGVESLEIPDGPWTFRVDLEGPEQIRVYDSNKKRIPLDLENLRNSKVAVFAQVNGLIDNSRWSLKLRQLLVVQRGDGCDNVVRLLFM
jgi:hypothetical protein